MKKRMKNTIGKLFIGFIVCLCLCGILHMPETAQAETFPEWHSTKNGTELKNFSIWDGNVVPLDTSDFSSKVTWSSSDPMVAYVVEDYLFAFKKGIATITAKADGKTKAFQVKVKSSAQDKLGLNSYEITLAPKETFQLYCGNTNEKVTWSSGNSKIASVTSKGKVKTGKYGKTTITATSRGKTVKCKVTVISKKDYTAMPNPGGYNLKQLTTKPSIIEDDRFVLIVDRGIYVPKNIKKRMNTIMDAIEKTTGLSFIPENNGIKRTTDKVVIYVSNRNVHDEAWVLGGRYVFLYPSDFALDTYDEEIVIHELLHEIQLRNYAPLGNCLTEGYAVYYTDKIRSAMGCNYLRDVDYNASTPWLLNITESNVDKSLTNPEDAHDSSYFFLKYLLKTYGKKRVKQIYQDITSVTTDRYKKRNLTDYEVGVNVLSEKEILDIIKKHTDKNVTKDFSRWIKKQYRSLSKFDFSGKKVKTMNVEYAFWGDGYNSAIYTYKNAVTLDYGKGIGFEQNVVGRKYWGMCGCAKGNGTMTFYDAKGKKLKTIHLNSKEDTRFDVKGASKIKLSGGNKVDMYYDNEHIFK